LKEIYSDPDASQAHRIKAAGLALPHEVPKLMPERAPLSAEPVIPLADLINQRRARQNALQGRDIEVVPDPSAPFGVRTNLLPKSNGSGRDD
jgi:hypothetical protein